MIRVISQEKITFGSRLRTLMEHKNMTSGMLCIRLENKGVKISKAAISQWLNERTVLTKQKEKILNALAEIFNVDVGYLTCTQVDPHVKDPVIEEPDVLNEISQIVNDWKTFRRAWDFLDSLDVMVVIRSDPEEFESSTLRYMKDGVVYTIKKYPANFTFDDKCMLAFPDGRTVYKNQKDLIDLYETIKDQCYNTLR